MWPSKSQPEKITWTLMCSQEVPLRLDVMCVRWQRRWQSNPWMLRLPIGTGTPPLWNGAMAAVMQMLYQSVVMKREPRLKVKLRNCHSLPSSTVWSQALSRDQISEITDMSFLHRVAGPTLRDRVRSSVIQQRQSRSPTLDSSTSKTTQDTGPHCKRGL